MKRWRMRRRRQTEGNRGTMAALEGRDLQLFTVQLDLTVCS